MICKPLSSYFRYLATFQIRASLKPGKPNCSDQFVQFIILKGKCEYTINRSWAIINGTYLRERMTSLEWLDVWGFDVDYIEFHIKSYFQMTVYINLNVEDSFSILNWFIPLPVGNKLNTCLIRYPVRQRILRLLDRPFLK